MSWVLRWVEWYLDEEGYPDKSKQGTIRYFVIVEDSPVFHEDPEWLKEHYPEQCRVYNPIDDVFVDIEPKSFTFVAGTIFDNPILLKSNPKYLADLKSLKGPERARLLDGNWYARPQGTSLFKRQWLNKIEREPPNCGEWRAWDKASTEPSEKNRNPDFTASIKMLKTTDGEYIIRGDFDDSQHDEGSEVYGKFRKRPGERDRLILKQAEADGDDCKIVLPKDPGAAGTTEYTESAKKLLEEGYIVEQDPSVANKSKATKFAPFSSACENGLVSIVESSFPNKATLEAFYKELEAFDGSESTRTKKDDWVDCTATGYNAASKGRVLPKFRLSPNTSKTRRSEVMSAAVPTF